MGCNTHTSFVAWWSYITAQRALVVMHIFFLLLTVDNSVTRITLWMPLQLHWCYALNVSCFLPLNLLIY